MIKERCVWIRIYGVPIHAWNPEFFRNFIQSFGCIIKVDECTKNYLRFDFARILIEVSNLDFIILKKKARIDEVLFDIKVIEKVGLRPLDEKVEDVEEVFVATPSFNIDSHYPVEFAACDSPSKMEEVVREIRGGATHS
jgi:hypothetical protein